MRPPVPPPVSYTGGIFAAGDVLIAPFTAALARLHPDVDLVPPRGGALDGAEVLALRAVAGTLAARPPLVTVLPAPS